jgi:hypothetical protein
MSDTISTVEMESRPVFSFHSYCWLRANEISFNFKCTDSKNWWVMIMGDRGTKINNCSRFS